MKEIPLTQGKVAIVDDEDYERLSQRKWHYHQTGYAVRTSQGNKTIRMHREIMGAKADQEVDHHNHDTLDNRRENLRLCSANENCHNRVINNNKKYKGTTWKKDHRKWNARIRLDGHLYHLGYFDDETNAAYAYDDAARELFGEFAFTNF